MKTPTAASARFAWLCAALFVVSPAVVSAGTVSGKVTDTQTGNPLPSMVVAAYSVDGILQASATSDSTGHYSITIPAGSYRVLAYDNAGVYATMYNGDAESFETSAPVAPDATNVNFALRRAGTISGSVATSTGAASGITVAAYNLDGTRRGFTTTNTAGAYTLVLPPGSYKVAAYDDAGALWPTFFQNQNSFAFANVVNVNAGQNSPMSFNLSAAAHIAGSVADTATNLPVSGLTVDAYDLNGTRIAEVTTDANGGFNLRLPAGTFRVVVSDPQQTYATAYYGGVNFNSATSILLNAGATQANVQIGVQRAGAISGQTTDVSGAPLNVTVAAYGLDGSLRAATQSANGAFKLLLPPGQYKVAAYDSNLVFATQFYASSPNFATATPVTVTAGVSPGPQLVFALSRGTHLFGNVIDADTRAALPNITIGIYDDATGTLTGTTTTDANGNYALVVPAGTYRDVASDSSLRYAASFAGGATYETAHAFMESSGATDQVNFTMARGIRVTGIVQDPRGGGISDVEVSALDPNGNHAGTATSSNGSFDLVLLPNQYRFLAVDPELRFTTATTPSAYTIAAGSPAPSVVITLQVRQRRRSVSH